MALHALKIAFLQWFNNKSFPFGFDWNLGSSFLLKSFYKFFKKI